MVDFRVTKVDLFIVSTTVSMTVSDLDLKFAISAKYNIKRDQ